MWILEYIIYAIVIAALLIFVTQGGILTMFERDDAQSKLDDIKKIIDKK